MHLSQARSTWWKKLQFQSRLVNSENSSLEAHEDISVTSQDDTAYADSPRTQQQGKAEEIRTNSTSNRQVLDAKLQIVTTSTKNSAKRIALPAKSTASSFSEVHGTYSLVQWECHCSLPWETWALHLFLFQFTYCGLCLSVCHECHDV